MATADEWQRVAYDYDGIAHYFFPKDGVRLSVRAINALERYGIATRRQFEAYDEWEYMNNVGIKTLKEFSDWSSQFGWTMRGFGRNVEADIATFEAMSQFC